MKIIGVMLRFEPYLATTEINVLQVYISVGLRYVSIW